VVYSAASNDNARNAQAGSRIGLDLRVFRTKWLTRYARRERIPDRGLNEAIDRAGRVTIEADLGGGMIKQRVARTGQGRFGGYRMLVAYGDGIRAVFL
jgi:hypothetical protein